MGRIGRIFIAGLMAALPLVITLAVTGWLVVMVKDYVGPRSWFGELLISLGVGEGDSWLVPYLAGLAIVIAGIFVLGILVESRIGGWFSAAFEGLLGHIPVVSSLYSLSKRFTSLVDLKGEDNLGSMSPVWCFFGGEPGAAVLALLPSSKPLTIGNEDYLGILIPSAPVPVGGALVYVPAKWIKPAEGGVEHLMSVYVSMGVTPPITQKA